MRTLLTRQSNPRSGKRDHKMKITNYSQNEDAAYAAIESQVAPFIAGLKREGYAYTIISTKHAALRRYLKSRRRLKRPSNEPDETEIAAFMARPTQIGRAH